MSSIGIAFFIFWSLIALGLYATNRDLLSPAKLFHVQALVFFLSLYIGPEEPSVYFMYCIILLLTAAFGFVEALSLASAPPRPWSTNIAAPPEKIRIAIFAIWILTAVPVMAQLYLFAIFGGVTQYLASLTLRVREFSGLGPLLTVIKILAVLNIVYFGLVLAGGRKTPLRWGLFIAHLILTTGIGLLSGSRGSTLMNFLLMAMMVNYQRKPIRLYSFAILGTVLVLAGVFIGVARNKVNYAELFSTGSIGTKLGTSFHQDITTQIRSDGTTNTGLYSIRLVLAQGVPNPRLGATFMTVVTNFVPRAWWPDKPKPGGVVLTEEYTKNAWNGLSNLSTGLFVEAMLNFGIIAGLFIGAAGFCLLFYLVLRSYLRLQYSTDNRNTFNFVAGLIIYCYSVQLFSGLLVAEFTNSLVPYLVQLFTLAGILLFIRLVNAHVPSSYKSASS